MVGLSYEGVGLANLVGQGQWRVAWGRNASNSHDGQLRVDISIMRRVEIGTMRGRAGHQGNV